MHGCCVPEQAALEALARARARTATVRSRQEAAAAAARPPALQRVAAAVPEGPLSLLRRACNSREQKVRVVTRHRRGVRGVATGVLLPKIPRSVLEFDLVALLGSGWAGKQRCSECCLRILPHFSRHPSKALLRSSSWCHDGAEALP